MAGEYSGFYRKSVGPMGRVFAAAILLVVFGGIAGLIAAIMGWGTKW